MANTTRLRQLRQEDVVPLTQIKVNPGRVVQHVEKSRRPVLLTNRGRGVAVMQSLSDYENVSDELAFLKAVVTGLADVEAGRTVSLQQVKKQFGCFR